VPAATRLPADAQALAAAHRARQQHLAFAAAQQAAKLWAFLNVADLAASWALLAPRMFALVTAALQEAARGSQDYVAASLRSWGAEPDPAGAVPPGAFARTASDGRPLDTLLGVPAFEAQALADQGMPATEAKTVGDRHLKRIVATQVADAARVATGVAQVNDRKTRGYIRQLTTPSCSRCVLLAGRWYAVNKGFQRHPLCDCVHMPAAEVIEPQDPKDLFDAMSDQDLAKAGWSKASVRAIREDGADIFQVTNARRELRTLTVAGRQVQVSTVGVTKRGIAGKRLGASKRNPGVRLTPESIYAEAERLGWSRDETIRQLKRFGYIL
jgi:hypothetical protein